MTRAQPVDCTRSMPRTTRRQWTANRNLEPNPFDSVRLSRIDRYFGYFTDRDGYRWRVAAGEGPQPYAAE